MNGQCKIYGRIHVFDFIFYICFIIYASLRYAPRFSPSLKLGTDAMRCGACTHFPHIFLSIPIGFSHNFRNCQLAAAHEFVFFARSLSHVSNITEIIFKAAGFSIFVKRSFLWNAHRTISHVFRPKRNVHSVCNVVTHTHTDTHI